MTTMRTKTLFEAVRQVRTIYLKRGFRVTTILLDGQFEPLRGELSTIGITLNTPSEDEHVPDVERYIRTVKERARCVSLCVYLCLNQASMENCCSSAIPVEKNRRTLINLVLSRPKTCSLTCPLVFPIYLNNLTVN